MQYNVEPLRSPAEIAEFVNLASLGVHGQRNSLLVLVGLNTGLRMSDILNLKAGQVRYQDIVTIIEQKTQKKRLILLTKLRPKLDLYIRNLADDDYLFTGQSPQHALSVNAVYKFFQTIARKMHRNDIGTHTLRKTFGYHYYQRTHDVGTLMMIFNHSSEAITKRYIGLNQDVILAQMANFSLGLDT
ncbi:integrase [Lactobacillus sp. CBA3606]|uniref:tyrosine-type recombinase/integrase n=1 Tax=Lactobacillus sp. CBA3606 TaxID=2099789 RepID=UPI000CFC4478|nr:tyrosine-type recombinase/integrase [Lactobacillus sp. CBA3606]AVK63338.1 integrase [Lactobacillus sp. CBA3606]